MKIDGIKTFASEVAATTELHDAGVVDEFVQFALGGVLAHGVTLEDAFRGGALIAASNRYSPDRVTIHAASDALLRDEKLIGRIAQELRGES